jgi:hypothetical protein
VKTGNLEEIKDLLQEEVRVPHTPSEAKVTGSSLRKTPMCRIRICSICISSAFTVHHALFPNRPGISGPALPVVSPVPSRFALSPSDPLVAVTYSPSVVDELDVAPTDPSLYARRFVSGVHTVGAEAGT